MPRWQAVPLLLALGCLLLVVAFRGYRSGELPAGRTWFKPYRPNRDDNPVAFHFYLAIYFCGGLALCVWGLLAMVGMAPSVRWR